MSTTSRRGAARLYLIGAIVTFAIAGFQLWSYYSGIAESVSLFADTFHAGSDGVTLLCTVLLLAFRARTNFRLEEGVHRSFTYFNIALLGAGVLLASWQLYVHRGDTVSPSWAVVVVALLGGLGDFIVWRLLLKVKHSDLPRSLWSNHSANVLHIAQDMWQSVVVVLAGIGIRFGVPYIDTIFGSAITLMIFWEGLGLVYEEWTGKHFPYHFHLFGASGHHHEKHAREGHKHHHH